MITDQPKKKLYIEASAITEAHLSGIGHSIVSTIQALSNKQEVKDNFEIVLLVSRGSRGNLDRWNFDSSVIKCKSIPVEKHILQVLLKLGLLPPMDWLFGKGIYIFPNYKNWPLHSSRSLTYVYDVAYLIHPETIQPKNLKMLQKHAPQWVKRTDKVITISRSSKREIAQFLELPQTKIELVFCGVDTELFYRQPPEKIAAVLQRYSIPDKYILYVGNIEPRKNILNLLLAFEKLPNVITDKYALVLVGTGGWLNSVIKEKIAALRRSGLKILHPEVYVPDSALPELYSGAQALIHPAIHEGFGIPPLQAIACGTPVAVSRIPALEEILGNAAIYFDPSDPNSIRDKILQIIREPQQSKFKIAAQELTKKYSWDHAAGQLYDIIKAYA